MVLCQTHHLRLEERWISEGHIDVQHSGSLWVVIQHISQESVCIISEICSPFVKFMLAIERATVLPYALSLWHKRNSLYEKYIQHSINVWCRVLSCYKTPQPVRLFWIIMAEDWFRWKNKTTCVLMWYIPNHTNTYPPYLFSHYLSQLAQSYIMQSLVDKRWLNSSESFFLKMCFIFMNWCFSDNKLLS